MSSDSPTKLRDRPATEAGIVAPAERGLPKDGWTGLNRPAPAAGARLRPHGKPSCAPSKRAGGLLTTATRLLAPAPLRPAPGARRTVPIDRFSHCHHSE